MTRPHESTLTMLTLRFIWQKRNVCLACALCLTGASLSALSVPPCGEATPTAFEMNAAAKTLSVNVAYA